MAGKNKNSDSGNWDYSSQSFWNNKKTNKKKFNNFWGSKI